MDTRKEIDPIGERAISIDAYYGIQTLRATENFPVSGIKALPSFIRTYVLIKKSAATTNAQVDSKNEQEYIEGWEKLYSRKENPFDINEPNEWIVELEASGKIRGAVLDAGCGTGDNALYLAAEEHAVVGIDISTKAIERAK